MLLRIARASPALARLRPLLQPAQRPAMAVAAGVAVNLFVVKGGVVSVPTDRAVVGMHATEMFFLSRKLREFCGDGREIRNKKSH